MIDPHPNPNDRYEIVAWAQELLASSSTVVVLDTETTGLGHEDEIIQIAISSLNGSEILRTLVRPSNRPDVPASATAIHGIATHHLHGMPTYADLKRAIAKALRGKTVRLQCCVRLENDATERPGSGRVSPRRK